MDGCAYWVFFYSPGLHPVECHPLLPNTVLGEGGKHLLTPAREPMTDQLKDTTRVQLDGPVSFVEGIYRSMGERLLLTRAERTRRQLRHQKPTSECVV